MNTFLQRLAQAEVGPGDAATCFVFDQAASPDLMGTLRAVSHGMPYKALPLLAGTGHMDRAREGPLWCEVQARSGQSRLSLYRAVQDTSGLVIETDDPLAAQLHARDLIYQHDGAGLWFSDYYNPREWGALALTATRGLFGPWRTVYSPATKHIGNPSGPWLRWTAPMQGDPLAAPYKRAADTYAVSRTLRWVYWLDKHFHAFGEPTTAQLPALISNLEFLVSHDIDEGRWLLKLAGLCRGGPLNERSDVRAILEEADAPFNHYLRLLAL
ncbi:hypothetical protein BWR15_30570 [Pseudomonas sp. T]|nr:hypothetical protein BWR15_30570 [Pseudomonas sp. T]